MSDSDGLHPHRDLFIHCLLILRFHRPTLSLGNGGPVVQPNQTGWVPIMDKHGQTSVRVPARWASAKSLPRQLPSSVLTWTHWLYASITCSCQLHYSWFVFPGNIERLMQKTVDQQMKLLLQFFLKMYFLCMCCCSHGEIFWVAMISESANSFQGQRQRSRRPLKRLPKKPRRSSCCQRLFWKICTL